MVRVPRSLPLWLLVAALVGVVSVPLVVNPRLHLRADALSNTAIAHAVLRHGVPPPDPYLAGQPLHYHWGYNALAAGIGRLLGAEPLAVMVCLGPAALAVLLVAIVRLARRLAPGEPSPRCAALTVVLALVGLNGWGWLALLARGASGAAPLADALGQGVHPYLRSVVAGYSELLGFLATKALVATSFTWHLAFVALALLGLVAYVQEGRWRQVVGFAAAAALAAYTNLFIGVLVLALVGALLGLWTRGYLKRGDRARARRPLIGLAGVAAAVLLVVPYLLVTAGAAMTRERLVSLAWPDGAHLLGLVLAPLPLWVAASMAGRATTRSVSQAIVAFVTVGLAVTFLVVRVVDEVEVKLVFLVALLLAAWVGGRAGELPAWRLRRLWLVAASCVPTTLLGLVAYARAPEPARATDAERTVLECIARTAPRDAVVVWADERATLVPPIARRDLYVPGVIGFHRAARYDQQVWDARSAQMRQLLDGAEPASVLDAIARDLGRPVVLITRGGRPAVRGPRFRLLIEADGLRAWQLAP